MKNITMKALDQLRKEIEAFNEKLYAMPEIDGHYSNLVEDINTEAKMTKKQRKDLAIKTLKEKFPKLYNLLFELDLISTAISDKLSEISSKLEDKEYEVEEIKERKEELQGEIDELST